MASKPETKATLTHGVGLSLVIANWLMAAWAVAWALQTWVVSTILLSLLTAVLVYSNLVLLVYHRPSRETPLDTLFIHTPMRLFLLLTATLLLPMSIFIMTGKTWDPKHAGDIDFASYQWQGLAVVLITNLVGWIIIVLRRDVAWCLGAIWINVCILTERPKSSPVEAAAITFIVLQPLGLGGAALWRYLKQREGAIRLPEDEEGNTEAFNVNANENINSNTQADAHNRNVERVWG